MSHIVILVASLGKNVELGAELEKIVRSEGGTPEVINLVELELPLYSTTAEAAGIPQAAKELTATLSKCSGMIVIAPEYNGSTPPALVNAISWVSRSTEGADWRKAFNGKPAVIGTHSGGGGAHVLVAMRLQLSFLGVNVLGRQLLTNFGKPLNPESAETVVSELIQLGASR